MNSSKLKDIYHFPEEIWGKIIIQKILLGQNFCASGHNLTNFEKYLPLYNKIKIINLIAPVEKSFCWFLVAVTPLFLYALQNYGDCYPDLLLIRNRL